MAPRTQSSISESDRKVLLFRTNFSEPRGRPGSAPSAPGSCNSFGNNPLEVFGKIVNSPVQHLLLDLRRGFLEVENREDGGSIDEVAI